MLRTFSYAVALVTGVSYSFAALAEETTTYTLERTETGYVRMNNRTGEMSICQERAGQLVCKLAAEERLAYDEDIADLKARVAKLEDTVSNMGRLPPAVRDSLPSSEDFERGLSYIEKFMRRFMGIAKEFENEGKESGPNDQLPQKT